jgi:hypothetical protein
LWIAVNGGKRGEVNLDVKQGLDYQAEFLSRTSVHDDFRHRREYEQVKLNNTFGLLRQEDHSQEGHEHLFNGFTQESESGCHCTSTKSPKCHEDR